MHTQIPIFLDIEGIDENTKINYKSLINENDLDSELRNNLMADYFDYEDIDLDQLKETNWFKREYLPYLKHDDIFVFNEENLLGLRKRVITKVKSSIEEIESIKDMTCSDWSHFIFELRHPGYLIVPEAIIIDKNGTILFANMLSRFCFKEITAKYLGMANYHS